MGYTKPKYIETDDEMWDLFERYVKEVKDNPRIKNVFVGKNGEPAEEKLERPLTMQGFRNFGHRNGVTLKHYFDNTDKRYEDYQHVCSRIFDEIGQDQIEGGMVGQYHHGLTARLNGLVDMTANTIRVEQPLFPVEAQKQIEDKTFTLLENVHSNNIDK